MREEQVLISERPIEGVARLTLNRPDKKNALSRALRTELVSELAQGQRIKEIEHPRDAAGSVPRLRKGLKELKMRSLHWGWLFAVALIGSASVSTTWAEASADNSAQNERIVREFVKAWSNLDADELVSYFASDGTYYNMPTNPVTGHEDLRAFISGFLASWEKTDWEVINLLADGDLVMVERMDRTTAAGRYIELPCFGVFEMKNGKIKVWRDYFDLATFTNAVAPSPEAGQ
jgi:limonene-1,2-epoxide hydrolase